MSKSRNEKIRDVAQAILTSKSFFDFIRDTMLASRPEPSYSFEHVGGQEVTKLVQNVAADNEYRKKVLETAVSAAWHTAEKLQSLAEGRDE